jgi:hypothetical protein
MELNDRSGLPRVGNFASGTAYLMRPNLRQNVAHGTSREEYRSRTVDTVAFMETPGLVEGIGSETDRK